MQPIVGQDSDVPIEVYLKQDGDSILINNKTLKIKRKPFTLIFVYNQPDQFPGVFVNTSLTKNYYKLSSSETIPDIHYLPQKVYSENKFNPKKELKVNDEFFQYFGYNPHANWNKFDRVIKKDGKIIAYRKVTNFTVVDDDVNFPIDKMKYTLYLTYVVIKKRNAFSNQEVYRATTKLKF
jgi:hypothetical protein